MKHGRWALTIPLLMFTVLRLTGASSQVDFAAITKNVFLGQAYPSGNVYLRSFADGRPPFPATLSFVALPDLNRTFQSSTSQATLSADAVPSSYIPAFERMDDQHDPCGNLRIPLRSVSFRYVSGDFFDALVDHCEANDNVAVYHSAPSSNSVMVLAFAPGIGLTNVHRVFGPRPMSAAERQIMSANKRSEEGNCTTTPAYLDSAMLLAEGEMPGGLTLRLSAYDNPGCAGHLATTYVMDVLRGTTVLEVFRLNQVRGVL